MNAEEMERVKAALQGTDFLPTLDETDLYLRENPKMDDLLYVGGTVNPRSVVSGYEKGLFPMYVGQDEDETLGWFSPQLRAGLDLAPYRHPDAKIKVHKSLLRSMRDFLVRVDTDFEGVVNGCAFSRDQGNWIDQRFLDTYIELYEVGFAHSIEIYRASEPDVMVGGLFGVGVGGLFSGESMFHTQPDASKAAFVALVALLNHHDYRFIDGQWLTPHLESLGMTEIRRRDYLAMLPTLIHHEVTPLGPGDFIDNPSRWSDFVII